MRKICQVCGTDLDMTDCVTCRECETPHHRDCAEYLCRCSTYGCAGQLIADARNRVPESRFRLEEEAPAEIGPGAVSGSLVIVDSASDRAAKKELVSLPLTGLVSRKNLLSYSPIGSTLALSAGEMAVEIPASVLPIEPRLYPLVGGTAQSALHAVGIVAAVVLLFLLMHPAFMLLGVFLLSWLARAKNRLLRLFRLPMTWLVRDGAGQIAVAFQPEGAAAGAVALRWSFLKQPVAIVLERVYEVADEVGPFGAIGNERLSLQYRVRLLWDEETGLDIIAGIQVPRPGEPRVAFLETLATARAVAQQIASLMNLPYREKFARDLTAPQGQTLRRKTV